MLHPFWKIWWLLSGWKISGNFPQEIPKLLMIVGPHTSWKDVVVGFAARSILGIDHARFLGKKELFDGPFGWLFRWLGGTPVDRFSSNGVVEQAADLFRKNERFLLAMSPEGTRKKVDRLRTGFYHIAKSASVPILMVAMDFKTKTMVFAPPFLTSDNEEADMKKILQFFAQYHGANPEFDLRHLGTND